MGLRRAVASLLLGAVVNAWGDEALQRDEEVLFLPTVAVPQADGSWQVPLHAWVFEPERDSIKRRALLALLAKGIGLSDETVAEADQRALFKERVRSFLVDSEGGKRPVVTIAGVQVALERSGSDGHCRARVVLDAATVAQHRTAAGTLVCTCGPLPTDPRVFRGVVHLLDAVGVSVVSDLDDTIKVTGARDRRETLRRTFLEPFIAVPGMATLYRDWLERGARIHVVSASPWQLFPHLDPFVRDAGFPVMSWHLKTVRWSLHGLDGLTDAPALHKEAVIPDLLDTFPRRRFVLVGDSGQQDPEVYGALARRHTNVVQILIRDVTGETADAERYRQAFADLPRERWALFTDPAAIADRLPR